MARSSSIHIGWTALAIIAMHLAVATATARLDPANVIASSSSTSASAQINNPTEGAAQHIVRVASASLQATFTSLDPTSSLFPDVVDVRTGNWHVDDINSNGAAGLLAGCLWSMYHLTGSDMWRTRALATSVALRPFVEDISLGQAIGTLTYPAIRFAYEAEQDPEEKQAYLDAALKAATTLSKLYAKIPGVLKVRPTSDIALEARQAGAAVISPLAVFSSPEGAAAATGLLAWAAGLPGGRAAWRDMALTNAKRIASDHMTDDGSIRGTLIYKATSAKAEPKELLSVAAPADAKPASTLSALLESITGEHTAGVESPSAVLESWLSSVAGQVSSPELRQAMTTRGLVEAVRAADDMADADALLSAAEAAASLLVSMGADPLAYEPVVAAASAAALAELSTVAATSSQRDAYSSTARHIVVSLASSRLASEATASGSSSGSGSDFSLEAIASRWISSLVPKLQQTQSPKALLLRGSATAPAKPSATAQPAAILVGSELPEAGARLSAALPESNGQAGSMLADFMLLQALVQLSTPAH